MRSDVEKFSLTSSEREMAREHWDAVMFAPSRTALESARLALMEAPSPIQQAVIADINDNWLREYEPRKEENPFLSPASCQNIDFITEDGDMLLEQIETFHVEPTADFSVPSYSPSAHPLSGNSFSFYAQRFVQSISQLSTPRIGGRMTS